MRACLSCAVEFPLRVVVDGKPRALSRRRFCLQCSPFAGHNTSMVPPGSPLRDEIVTARRRYRNASSYRMQKERRQRVKAQLIAERGGDCTDCGYSACVAALEFHHRDERTKEFAIGGAGVSRERLWSEAGKCDLVCANCHRARHAAARNAGGGPVVGARRRTKQRAVELLGGRCQGCGTAAAVAAFEFHHLDAATKEFAISADGVPRRWELIVAELAKCALLCANCHREVHAGVRKVFDDGLLGLAEGAAPYRFGAARPMEVRGAPGAQRIPVSAWSSTSV